MSGNQEAIYSSIFTSHITSNVKDFLINSNCAILCQCIHVVQIHCQRGSNSQYEVKPLGKKKKTFQLKCQLGLLLPTQSLIAGFQLHLQKTKWTQLTFQISKMCYMMTPDILRYFHHRTNNFTQVWMRDRRRAESQQTEVKFNRTRSVPHVSLS